jgi:hypothetical protein
VEDLLSQLALALGILALLGCPLLFFLAGAGLIAYVAVGRTRPLSAQEKQQAEPEAERELAAALPRLRPWEAGSFEDLTARWHGRLRWGRLLAASGDCRSLRSPEQALLTAVLRWRGSTGFLLARTSGQSVRFDLAPGGDAVAVDGRRLGTFARETGEIRDAHGQPVGRCPRGSVSTHAAAGDYPLALNGRDVAAISRFQSGPVQTQEPLVLNRRPDATREELDWLLALCALEIGLYRPLYFRVRKVTSARRIN